MAEETIPESSTPLRQDTGPAGWNAFDFTADDIARDLRKIYAGGSDPEMEEPSPDSSVHFEPEIPPKAVELSPEKRLFYKIGGTDIQYLRVDLAPGRKVFSEPGALRCYPPALDMTTRLLAPEQKLGLKKILGPVKRLISGENAVLVCFDNRTDATLPILFAAPYPGTIKAFDMGALKSVHCLSGSFLCGAGDIDIAPALSRVSTGLFSGSGFLLQKITGEGTAFIHAAGSLVEIEILPGAALRIDTGSLVAWDSRLTYDISFNKGIFNQFLSGEGFFFTNLDNRLHGQVPLKAWVQTMPIRRHAQAIWENLPSSIKKKSSGRGQ